jgi:hypothetical protein
MQSIEIGLLEQEIKSLESQLNHYYGFTNMIDDYFEYRCKSEDDQKFVHDTLKSLTDALKT